MAGPPGPDAPVNGVSPAGFHPSFTDTGVLPIALEWLKNGVPITGGNFLPVERVLQFSFLSDCFLFGFVGF